MVPCTVQTALAWTWRYTCVQEAGSCGDRPAAVLGRHDLGAVYGGCKAQDRCNMCVGMWVQGLGQGRAAIHGAAEQGCLAVMAQDCVGVVEVSTAGVLLCVQRL